MVRKCIVLALLLLSIGGCSQEDVVTFDKNTILVMEQRVGDEFSNDYEVIKEIDDTETVQKVIDIFKSARWETNVDVDMPREPDYKIHTNYHIWGSPKRNTLEIIHTEDSYYVQLSTSQSSKLYTIMTRQEH